MPDSVPNYITIDPVTGAVGAQFSGHVAATGIDLTPGVASDPPSINRVQWLRASDGARVASLYAIEQGPGPQEWLVTKAVAPDTTAVTAIEADGSTGEIARVRAVAGVGQSFVEVATSGGTVKLLDGTGASDFMRSARPAASAALALVNPPWSQFATPWGPAFWRQQANGLVTLYGLIQSTGAFGLPLNICGGLPTPKDINGNAQNVLFGCYTSANNIARVDIQANGVMLMNTGGAAPTAAGWWFNLNGISYYA